MWVNKALEDIGVGKFHILQNILVGTIFFVDGGEVLMVSSIISTMEGKWDLPPLFKGAAMSIIFVGVLIGGLIGGPIADCWGRRPTLLACFMGVIVFGVMSSFSSGPMVFVCFRFVVGEFFGAGVGPALALLVETASTRSRAHLVNWNQSWFCFGEIYTCLLMLHLLPTLSDDGHGTWRKVPALMAVPCALAFPVACIALRESPHFLEATGQHHEAAEVLRDMGRMNGCQDLQLDVPGGHAGRALEAGEQTPLLQGSESPSRRNPELEEGAGSSSSTMAAPASRASHSSAERFSARAQSPVAAEGGVTAKFSSPHSSGSADGFGEDPEEDTDFAERIKVIFSPSLRSIIAGGAYFCFLGNFLFYGLNFALPQVFKQLEKDFQIGLSPTWQTLIASIADLPGILVVMFILMSKSFGHRDGLLCLALSAAFFQVMMATISRGVEWMALALPATYLSKFTANALFNLTYIYLGEVFPSECRCTALAVCFAAGRLGSILAPLIFEAFNEVSGPAAFFLLDAGLCGFAVVVVKTLLTFELKNEPLEDHNGVASKRRASAPGSLLRKRKSSHPSWAVAKLAASRRSSYH